MRITAARFLGAAAKPGETPPVAGPEVAVAGRSNVGKSSLINTLVGRNGLARTSSTPGRTRQINFFLLNEAFVLADLPGYGFAVGPIEEKASWKPLVESYLVERASLCGVLLIVDVRRGIEDEERELLHFLAALARPVCVAATKLDKFKRAAGAKALAAVRAQLPAYVPLVGYSALNGDGREPLWKILREWVEPRKGAAGHSG
jgi:GTP-binding protein